MRLVACALLAGCIPSTRVEVTSERFILPAESELAVASPPNEAAQLVIEKLGARGFTLVATSRSGTGVRLKLAGNRDFSGIHTLGSVYYAWIDAVAGGAKVRLVGKPTVDHVEGCPAYDGDTCAALTTDITWGISGREEAQVIRGVIAELVIDDVALAARPDQVELDGKLENGLTLRGCGGPLRWTRASALKRDP